MGESEKGKKEETQRERENKSPNCDWEPRAKQKYKTKPYENKRTELVEMSKNIIYCFLFVRVHILHPLSVFSLCFTDSLRLSC